MSDAHDASASNRRQAPPEAQALPDAASFAALVRWRRDVRRFKTDPLPPGRLDQLLGLSDLAPSVGNSQPWRIVEVVSPHVRAAARTNFERANAAAADGYDGARRAQYQSLKLAGFDCAPVHLAVLCDPDPAQGHGLGRQTQPLTLDYSCAGFITVLWLAARTHGLGLGWVSILDPDAFVRTLDVPPNWRFVGYLLLGYPEADHDEPELARLGWQSRTPGDRRRFVR